MGAIMGAYKSNAWTLSADGSLSIGGQSLLPEEFELRLVMKEGISGQALSDNTAVVQLDTTVDADLEKEGIARDFVRLVQQARKDSGFDVSDRIELGYQSKLPLVMEALKQYQPYIQEQVLALKMEPQLHEAVQPISGELADEQVQITLKKV